MAEGGWMKTADFTKICTCSTEAYFQTTGGCPVHGIIIKLWDSATFPKYEKEFKIETFSDNGKWEVRDE